MNSALAAYIFLQPEEAFPDVASDNVVVTTLEYRNDPTIPPERKFEPLGTQVLEKNDPRIVMAREDWSRGYDETAMMGRQSLGDSYRGTGTYLLFVRFRPQDPSVGSWGLEPVVWTQHFNIDEARARAKLACRDAIHQLEENIREGKKMRICCSTHSQRWPCCCKGRTHDDDEWDHEDEDDEWDEDEDDEWDEEDEWDDEASTIPWPVALCLHASNVGFTHAGPQPSTTWALIRLATTQVAIPPSLGLQHDVLPEANNVLTTGRTRHDSIEIVSPCGDDVAWTQGTAYYLADECSPTGDRRNPTSQP